MKRLFAPMALLFLVGCPAFVGDVQLVVWQPDAVEGDQLEQASEFVLEVETATEVRTQTFTDPNAINLAGLNAPVDGGDARITMNLVGGSADGALGRAGVTLAPGAAAIQAAMVLAPRDTLLELSRFPTDDRAETGVCVDEAGRVLIVSGRSTANALAVGTIVVDSVERTVRAGPALAESRKNASCAIRGGVAWVYGGCDENDQALGGLFRAENVNDPDAAQTFEQVEALPQAGCSTSMSVVDSGGVFINDGERVQLRDEDGQAVTPPLELNETRLAATVVAFPGDQRFAISGGHDTTGVERSDTLIVRLNDDGSELVTVSTVEGTLAARNNVAVYVFRDNTVFSLDEDGVTEEVADAPLPFVAPTRMFVANASASEPVPLFAFVDARGDRLQTAGKREASFALSPARPGGYVVADPGGALFFLGGAQPGVDVLVLE